MRGVWPSHEAQRERDQLGKNLQMRPTVTFCYRRCTSGLATQVDGRKPDPSGKAGNKAEPLYRVVR